MRGTRRELSTVGFDQDLQLIGSDPYHSPYYLGQIIPATPAPAGARYLYMLSFTSLNAGEKQRLVGIRQLLTIAQYIAEGDGPDAKNYPLELEIESPFWKFPDGNVSWHLRRVAPGKVTTNNAGNAEGLQFRYGSTPCLLFETPPSLGYVPPNGGQPMGNALPEVPDLATFHDLRFPYRSSQTWSELDIEIEGPCDIVLYASVLQTNPSTRATYTIPDTFIGSTVIPKETSFTATNGPAPSAVYKRIAGNMVFENPNQIAAPLELEEMADEMRPWLLPH